MRQLRERFNVNHFIVSQTNPHTAPLLRLKELVRVYGGDFAAKLAHLAEMEVKYRCNQVVEMGFGLHGIAKVFAQDWEGVVTRRLGSHMCPVCKAYTKSYAIRATKARGAHGQSCQL